MNLKSLNKLPKNHLTMNHPLKKMKKIKKMEKRKMRRMMKMMRKIERSP